MIINLITSHVIYVSIYIIITSSIYTIAPTCIFICFARISASLINVVEFYGKLYNLLCLASEMELDKIQTILEMGKVKK